MPEHYLASIEEKYERPCPRVELDPANGPLVNLSIAYFDEALRPLLPIYFETYLGALPEADRPDALDLFTAAIRSEAVSGALSEQREAAVERAKERGTEQAQTRIVH